MRSESTGHLAAVPGHVAIIMDGNGRWAKQQGKPRLEGHRRGADKARAVVRWAADLGVRQISLYAFSTENWQRPQAEVRGLMALLATLLPMQLKEMNKEGVRLLTLGDISVLPSRARRAVEKVCESTRHNTRIDLVLCLNYGGQQEIIEGVRHYCRWLATQADTEATLSALNAEQFRTFIRDETVMPVDLLIRTGGEKRISNFHLWDAAYAELYFSDTLWPDYSMEDLTQAVADYAGRERRFGLISEQL